jgi:hypothetical protein
MTNESSIRCLFFDFLRASPTLGLKPLMQIHFRHRVQRMLFQAHPVRLDEHKPLFVSLCYPQNKVGVEAAFFNRRELGSTVIPSQRTSTKHEHGSYHVLWNSRNVKTGSQVILLEEWLWAGQACFQVELSRFDNSQNVKMRALTNTSTFSQLRKHGNRRSTPSRIALLVP